MFPLASRISPRGADKAPAKKCWRFARLTQSLAFDDLHLRGSRNERDREQHEEGVNDRDALRGFHLAASVEVSRPACRSECACRGDVRRRCRGSVARTRRESRSRVGRARPAAPRASRRACARRSDSLIPIVRRHTIASATSTKRGENDGHQRPSAKLYAAFRHALSRALRERGFVLVSVVLAVSARLVRTSPRDFPRQVHCSCFGWANAVAAPFADRVLDEPVFTGVIRDHREDAFAGRACRAAAAAPSRARRARR